MTYFERLRAIREDKDISQRDFARLMGTTPQQMSKYELGQQEMTVSRLIKACEILGVSADYLLGLPKNLHWPR